LAARIWPPDVPIKSGRKLKPAVKRSAPSKRIDRCENSTIATVNSIEISPVVALAETEKDSDDQESENTVSPVILPAISDEISNIHTLPISFLMAPDGSNCKDHEPRAPKMVAAIVVAKKARANSQWVVRPMIGPKTVAPECEGQKPDSGTP